MTRAPSLQKDLRPAHVAPFTIRWLRYLIPLLMGGLAVHLLLPQLADLSQSWQTVRQMPLWLIILAVAAQMASYGGSGYLLAQLAAMLDERLSLWRGVFVTLAGSSMGLVVGGVVGGLGRYNACLIVWARDGPDCASARIPRPRLKTVSTSLLIAGSFCRAAVGAAPYWAQR